MVAAKSIKETILEELKTKEIVCIPASEADYLDLASKLPFKVEYHNSEIITMGLASFWHETIIGNMIWMLKNLFSDSDEHYVLGSNSGVQIPKFEGGYYMPDVLVVKGEPIFKANSTAIITNPYIVIEVLSKATETFDLSDKLHEYKHLGSLQQIIFINQKKVGVMSYLRSENPNIWLNQDFYNETDVMQIDGKDIAVKEIYKKVKFEK
ncbi:Uma2 family endonuclease [Emticicia sp. W12TSBA100-4]|uniref:Uma2 family endonuclease n=1 Tax=Emticicia sp. W12TSBA100-4 TaxID=3160965 RepID=UPI003305C6A2